MTYGKGTYGSKVGRPSKADKMNPTLKEMAMKKMKVKAKSVTLLKEIDKELQSIPLYKGEKVYETGGRDPYNFAEATKNAITGLRRGIRMLRGKESKPDLLAKKKRLENLMERAQNSIRGF